MDVIPSGTPTVKAKTILNVKPTKDVPEYEIDEVKAHKLDPDKILDENTLGEYEEPTD